MLVNVAIVLGLLAMGSTTTQGAVPAASTLDYSEELVLTVVRKSKCT